MSAILHILSTIRQPPLKFNIVQSSVSGDCSQVGGSCTSTSSTATTTVSGGAGGYTYAWTFVSGDSFTIITPTSSSTTFSKTNNVAGSPSFNGIYRCKVTDDNSNERTDTVSVTLTFTDLS